MKATEAPKIKNPHPLMQQGTPPVDIEGEHILKFTVFRLGGGGPPVHVETLDAPMQFLDPGDVKRLVGGGQYIVKALANQHTSQRTHGSVMGTTNYSWDGSPNVKSAPVSPYANGAPPAPTPSFFEQAASNGPAIVGAITAGLGGIMQIINSGREAREREERARREYEETKRREEREDRDRKEARDREHTEERREADRRRDEERREKERAEAEERRGERERAEQTRLDQMRADAEARQARETMLLNALMTRRDPNEAIMQILAQKALNPTPQPQQAAPTVDGILDAAKKLKEFADGDGTEKIIAAMMPLAATPVGQVMMARLGSIANLCPRPEEMMGPQQSVVTQEPLPMEQLPPVPPPPHEHEAVAPGPVVIN